MVFLILVVAYDLHSKWPEVIPMGTVTIRAMVDILDMLFVCGGLPQAITTDKGGASSHSGRVFFVPGGLWGSPHPHSILPSAG